MEIDIASFFKIADPFKFSHSIAEGGQTAAKDTWNAAVREGSNSPLLTTPGQLQALRDHVKEFGAWDAAEIAAWSNAEVNALFIQLVSGDIREAGLDTDDPDWEAYEEGVEAGQFSGNIEHGDDGRVWYYLGT